MLIPYRAKNPVRHFPIATASIIAVNVLVYIFTTHSLLQIKEGVIKDFACLVGVSPVYTFITATFLHGDPLHLIGNMLFLWVFGPSVEDRLGIPKYLGLYFLTGIVGALLQALFSAIFMGENLPGIGASGCIMGVVGAYWYMFSWSPICCVYWFGWFFRGLAEIAAVWVIGFYVLLDMFNGFMDSALGVSGGVGNFAHIGGTVTGALFCMLLKVKRDSSEVSEAKAMHSDAKDLDNMPVHALEAMTAADPHNAQLVRALVFRGMHSGNVNAVSNAMMNAGPALIDKDPNLVATYVTDMRGDAGVYRSIQLLRLASMMDRQGDPVRAAQLYHLIAEQRPNDPEAETALYRLAMAAWNIHRNAEKAKGFIAELQNRFPHGEMVTYANALLRKIG